MDKHTKKVAACTLCFMHGENPNCKCDTEDHETIEIEYDFAYLGLNKEEVILNDGMPRKTEFNMNQLIFE